MKSIKTNAVLNVIKTSVTIAFSLITYPYAMRVLGVNNIGAVNYVQSVINYFALFAMLGVSSYAIREGAKLSNKYHFYNHIIFRIIFDCFICR